MSDTDQTSTLDQPAPAPPPGPVVPVEAPASAPEKPRFLDQVMGMRAVIAVALAAVVIGGLSGFLLGEHAGGGQDGFGRGGPGGFRQGFGGGPPGMSQQWGQQGSQPGQQGNQQWGQQGQPPSGQGGTPRG